MGFGGEKQNIMQSHDGKVEMITSEPYVNSVTTTQKYYKTARLEFLPENNRNLSGILTFPFSSRMYSDYCTL